MGSDELPYHEADNQSKDVGSKLRITVQVISNTSVATVQARRLSLAWIIIYLMD